MPSKTVTAPHESDINVGRYNYDTAYVKGNATGGAPTGTVTFYVCGPTPGPVACKSMAHQLGSPVPLTPGKLDASSASSAKFSPETTGYYCFAGYYSGSSIYAPSHDNSIHECDAAGNATGGGTIATGTVQCDSFVGKLKFSIPLVNNGSSTSEKASMSGTLSGCSSTGSNVSVTSATFSGTFRLATNSCAFFTTPTSASLAISWKASEGIEQSVLTFKNVTPYSINESFEFLLPTGPFGYSAADTGSFANFDAGSSSSGDFQTANPQAACAGAGLKSLAISGGSFVVGP